MDELKQSVQLAVHEQKDPLLIYKFEAFNLFRSMLDGVNKEVISFLFKGDLPQQNNTIQEASEVKRPKKKITPNRERRNPESEFEEANRRSWSNGNNATSYRNHCS